MLLCAGVAKSLCAVPIWLKSFTGSRKRRLRSAAPGEQSGCDTKRGNVEAKTFNVHYLLLGDQPHSPQLSAHP